MKSLPFYKPFYKPFNKPFYKPFYKPFNKKYNNENYVSINNNNKMLNFLRKKFFKYK